MTLYPALAGLRIGCVRYLNSRPLIQAYPGAVWFAHPSELARGMAAGSLEAALVPIFEAFGPRRYLLVDGVAIASDGPVYSVFLAYRGELAAVEEIELDPGSLTSVHLVQILLAEFHGRRPRCVPEGGGGPATARLLIGNQAIDFRREASPEWRFLDLGEEWQRCTGLPFVFAAWLLRPGVAEAASVAEDFRRLKRDGQRMLPEIIAAEKDPFARTYLTQHIRFDLGPRERAAIERFRELARVHGFLAGPTEPLEFI